MSASTSVPNGEQKSTSSTGEAPALTTDWTIRDDLHDDAIRGTSPVSGLEGSDGWENTSLNHSGGVYENVSVATGAATQLGSWPIDGSALNPPLSKAKGPGTAGYQGHHPGQG